MDAWQIKATMNSFSYSLVSGECSSRLQQCGQNFWGQEPKTARGGLTSRFILRYSNKENSLAGVDLAVMDFNVYIATVAGINGVDSQPLQTLFTWLFTWLAVWPRAQFVLANYIYILYIKYKKVKRPLPPRSELVCHQT